MNDIIKTINSVQVTKAFPNCLNCGLPITVCICDWIESAQGLSLDFHLHIIMHEKELGRNTNTGRLPGLIFEKNTTYYIWKRKEAPAKLISAMENESNLFVLLYPSDDESKVMTPAEVNEIRSLCDVKLNVLVIDGTWQESVKIVNRTPYLKNVKRLAISQGEKSLFHLRRNQKDGNLCTSEAIAAAMMQLGFENESKVLNDLTELFLKKYEKGRGGYGL